MLIVNLYCSTVRALAMPYNKVMLIKPNIAKQAFNYNVSFH
jgi:hypothetical protein